MIVAWFNNLWRFTQMALLIEQLWLGICIGGQAENSYDRNANHRCGQSRPPAMIEFGFTVSTLFGHLR